MIRTAALILLGLVTAVPAMASDRCAAPAELTDALGALRNTARAVSQRQALAILVVGSGSSIIGGTSSPAALYPARMEAELHALLPEIAVRVATAGGRGITATEMLAVLRDALRRDRADLVVWQTGTVDAVRGVDPDAFFGALTAGVEAAAEAGADVVLVDMQFTRFGRATVNYGPYREAMESVVAGTDRAWLFPRYELMRHWAEAGQIDLEQVPRPAWVAEADLLHACLGRVLATAIAQGLRRSQ